jgi:hypothetical protein
MNPFLEQFRDLSTEYLLERRALGPDALVPEAHDAIEQLLRERNVSIPPMPSRPIVVQSATEPNRSSAARNVVLVVAALIAVAVAKQFALTWVGLLFTAAIVVYLVVDWFRRQGLSESERAAEDENRQASRDGLSSLMRSAAAGDIARVKELLAYGVAVNARSGIGSTALMYAAKNGHEEVVLCLLQAGADATIRTDKGGTAAELARRAGHEGVLQLLARTRDGA